MNPNDSNFYGPLILKAQELIEPSRIILFGSFSRNDFRSKSDIDLAFEFKASEVDEHFKQSIEKSGKVLYERKD